MYYSIHVMVTSLAPYKDANCTYQSIMPLTYVSTASKT